MSSTSQRWKNIRIRMMRHCDKHTNLKYENIFIKSEWNEENEKVKWKKKCEQWIAPFGFDFSLWTQMGKTNPARRWLRRMRCDSFAIRTNICCLYKLHFFLCSVCVRACALFCQPFQKFAADRSRNAIANRQRYLCVLRVHTFGVHSKSVCGQMAENKKCSFFVLLLLLSLLCSDSISRLSPLFDYKCATSRRGDDKIFKCVNARSSVENVAKKKTRREKV